ncbi:MAG: glycoside hydrolase family 3 C-terminal domain-containing protein, partial [Henriciella sp.]|nr:glycoside hydrolase family 3 C-terminal domain-containing protein [Henriciella sp.]
GTAADSIAQASGGWTLTWQGGGELTNDYFPGATSIYAGLAAAAEASGGSAVLAENGEYSVKPDVAIVGFGEQPYAEFAGDKRDLVFRDEEGLALLNKFAADDIPTVAVFLSGRPLWMNREINAADAFAAAWLPGGEGAGIADVLYGATDATGRLSFSWPSACGGTPVNGYEGALFTLGYGLSFGADGALAPLDETCEALLVGDSLDWFSSGRLGEGVTVRAGAIDVPQMRGSTDFVSLRGVDKDAQEDARELSFSAGGSIDIDGSGEDQAFRIVYQVSDRPTGTVLLSSGDSTLDATAQLSVAAGKGWREMVLTKSCLPEITNALRIETDGDFTMRIHTISREALEESSECSF